MTNYLHLAVCALLSVVLCLDIVNGLPLLISSEDVASLLPETPKTKNETVAAIVQDTVIQQAVQSTVGDGTLSGLVVKKNTVILPADQPDLVLTHKEQILRAPISQLENIRKNITDAVAATTNKENAEVTSAQEITLAQVIPVSGSPMVSEILVAEKPADGVSPQSIIAESLIVENDGSTKSPQTNENSGIVTVGQKFVVPGIVQNTIQLPEGVYPQNITLPSIIDAKISRPVVAVVHPKNVISLTPSSTTTEIIDTAEDSKLETLVFGDRIPVAVVKEDQNIKPAVELEARRPDIKPGRDVAVVFTIPEENGSSLYNIDDNDMVAAEDIVFRPLFRYRQQENERTRIIENRTYRRNSYNRYRPSNAYSSGNSPYRRPQRPRYYNDYVN